MKFCMIIEFVLKQKSGVNYLHRFPRKYQFTWSRVDDRVYVPVRSQIVRNILVNLDQ
jgi:hypothetical protein